LSDTSPDTPVLGTTVDEQKSHLRDQARRTRSELASAAPSGCQAAFNDNLRRVLSDLPAWQVISGYLAIGDEIDPLAVLHQLKDSGKTCVLPVVVAREQPLIFRTWEPGCLLESGPLNTRHPGAAMPAADPDVLLVPLLAFARDGYRLGWGGGFYDRTLAAFQEQRRAVVSIGIAYSGQEVDNVPHDVYDQRVDFVVTEAGIISTGQEVRA